MGWFCCLYLHRASFTSGCFAQTAWARPVSRRKEETITSTADSQPAVKDYSGVPTAELAALYQKHKDGDLRSFALRIDIDERALHKTVIAQDYVFTGWSIAEKILSGLGLNSSMLLNSGELHQVPARDSANAARKIVEDVYFAWDMPIPEQPDALMQEMVEELLILRRQLCVLSPEQKDRLRRDSERSARRRGLIETGASS